MNTQKEIEVYNLNDEATGYTFSGNTSKLWAIAYCYCTNNNLTSALFTSQQDGKFEQFAETLPIVRGTRSIACGDWATIRID
jgi:hypothetical protein